MLETTRSAKTSGGAWVALAVVFAMSALCTTPLATISQNPPRVQESWIVTGIAACISLIASLAASRQVARPGQRITCGVTAFVSIAALAIPIDAYRHDFGDYNWQLVGPLLLGTAVAAWFCGQKWLTIFVPILVAAVVVPGISGGKLAPLETKHDDITVRLDSVERDQCVVICRFTVLGNKPDDLTRTYDLMAGEKLNVRLGPLVGVSSSHARMLPWEESRPNRRVLSARSHPPCWARSQNVSLLLPRWPAIPAASVAFAVPAKNARTGSVEAVRQDAKLTVADVRWGSASGTYPTVECLKVNVSISGPHVHGFNTNEYRFMDDTGVVFKHMATSSGPGDNDARTTSFDLMNVRPTTKRIILDYFTRQQRAGSLVRFDFGKVRITRRPSN